jgi:hypothetical protein
LTTSIRVVLPVPPSIFGLPGLLVVLGASLGQALAESLVLLAPVAAFFIVCADSQSLPQPLTLFLFGFGQVVYLMRFQSLGIGAEVLALFALFFEFPAQRLALVVDIVLVDTRVC